MIVFDLKIEKLFIFFTNEPSFCVLFVLSPSCLFPLDLLPEAEEYAVEGKTLTPVSAGASLGFSQCCHRCCCWLLDNAVCPPLWGRGIVCLDCG